MRLFIEDRVEEILRLHFAKEGPNPDESAPTKHSSTNMQIKLPSTVAEAEDDVNDVSSRKSFKKL